MYSDPHKQPAHPCFEPTPVAADDNRDASPHKAVGCVCLLLAVFVLFFSVGGLVARIEPGELTETIAIDVAIGFAIIAIAALKTCYLNRQPLVYARIIGIVVLATMWSGALIGWHCFIVHARESARLMQQRHQKRQADVRSLPFRRISFAGTMAALIPHDYRAQFHAPDGGSPIVHVVDFRVPAGNYGAAFIEIMDTAGQRVLGVMFQRPPFDKGEDLSIRLDRPAMDLTIEHRERHLFVNHTAWIGDRVYYTDLPVWDKDNQRLAPGRPPQMSVFREGRLLFSDSMEAGGVCMSVGWYARAKIPPEIRKGEMLSIVVTSDTGDLFGRLTATKSFVVPD